MPPHLQGATISSRVPPHCPQALTRQELSLSPMGTSTLGSEPLRWLLPAIPGRAHVPWAALVPGLEVLWAGEERTPCERWASTGMCVQGFGSSRELLQCHADIFSGGRSCLHSFLMLGIFLLTPLPYLNTLHADESRQGVLLF